MREEPAAFCMVGSDIEEEFDDVAVLDDVFLALQAHLARLARSRVVASRREIVVAHNLRADEAAFEVRVDLASRLWRLCAAADRLGAGFLFARREVADQAQQLVGRRHQTV